MNSQKVESILLGLFRPDAVMLAPQYFPCKI